jgi:hypothetical protein
VPGEIGVRLAVGGRSCRRVNRSIRRWFMGGGLGFGGLDGPGIRSPSAMAVGSAITASSVLTVIGMPSATGLTGKRSSGDRVLAVPRGILAVASIVCADGRAGFACEALVRRWRLASPAE